MVCVFTPRVFLRVLWFSSFHKNQHSKLQFNLETVNRKSHPRGESTAKSSLLYYCYYCPTQERHSSSSLFKFSIFCKCTAGNLNRVSRVLCFLLLCIFRHFTLSVFNCMLPGTMVLVLGFFAILHSWLNAFAEMTRFADRMFYEVSKNHLTVSANWNVNTLHPNISMHILHTVLHASPLLLTRRICVLVKSVFTW